MEQSSLSTMTALKDMLSPEEDRQQEKSAGSASFASPGSIGSTNTAPPVVTRKSQKEQAVRKENAKQLAGSKDIWTEDEVQADQHNTLDDHDDRPEPTYGYCLILA